MCDLQDPDLKSVYSFSMGFVAGAFSMFVFGLLVIL